MIQDMHIAGWHYANPSAKALIHQLKYNGVWMAGEVLVSAWNRYTGSPLPAFDSPVQLYWVYVPTTPKRLRERGYHQAEVLARAMARVWGGRVRAAFIRREQPTQVGLHRQERIQQATYGYLLRRSFKVTDGAVYVIVDDTKTSGATLSRCRALLLERGAQRIYTLSLLLDE
jgi:predicted amidophosphoribosyltransferase